MSSLDEMRDVHDWDQAEAGELAVWESVIRAHDDLRRIGHEGLSRPDDVALAQFACLALLGHLHMALARAQREQGQ